MSEMMASDVLSPALSAAERATRYAAGRVKRAHDDTEAVHDLRVGIRRARTVLMAGRRLYGRKHADALGEQLRAVSKATNALRDEEVLGDTIGMLELAPDARASAKNWIERRLALLGELRALGLAMLDGSNIDALLDAVGELAAKPPRRDAPAEAFARVELGRARAELCAVLPYVSVADGHGLHRLRIRFKRLRYVAEMLGGNMRASDDEPVLPDADEHLAIARHAAGYQKELGLVHDADVALETAKLARDIDEPTRAAVVTALAHARDKLAHRAVERLVTDLPSIALPDAFDWGEG